MGGDPMTFQTPVDKERSRPDRAMSQTSRFYQYSGHRWRREFFVTSRIDHQDSTLLCSPHVMRHLLLVAALLPLAAQPQLVSVS
jgi:hypothetical protein